MKIISAILFVSIFTTNCKKTDAPNHAGKIDVTRITETDNLGLVVSQIDKTDWTLDNTWTTEELALFLTPTSTQLANSERATVEIKPGFPNPNSSSLFNFTCSTTKPTFIQIVTVDSMLSIKDIFFLNTTATGLNINTLALTSSKYLTNNYCRIYYAFYSQADGLYYKGHGDVKITR
jgi:hypothetical protein